MSKQLAAAAATAAPYAAVDAPRTPQLNDVEDVVARLKICRASVFGLFRTGELRSVKVGRRRLVTEAALCEFIEKLEAGAA
jgi:Helix-turn-helix domain